ncbi:MAG: hypothetical protein JXB49_04490, partial [Bacteroidales bacterium]|nr:hypothetical protein [Bacteroidales bacterium]
MKLKNTYLEVLNKATLVAVFIFSSLSINSQSISDWYSTAQQRIDTLRKGNFGFIIQDKNGQPFSGPVSVRMSKHEFPFGIAFDMNEGTVFNGNAYTTTSTINASAD